MSEEMNLKEQLERFNAFAEYAGVKIERIEKDFAQASLVIEDYHKNPHGNIHGGALFTLADNCAGGAAYSDGRKYVTQNASVSFIKGVSKGKLTATAQAIHRGRKTCLIEVKVRDEEETLIMQVMFTFYCIQ